MSSYKYEAYCPPKDDWFIFIPLDKSNIPIDIDLNKSEDRIYGKLLLNTSNDIDAFYMIKHEYKDRIRVISEKN